MQLTTRLLVAIAPLLLTALFAWLVIEGHMNLGGGDKDVLLVAPPLLWSLVYLVCFALLWRQDFALGRSTAAAGGVATSLMAIAWIALYVFSLIVSS